MKHKKTIIIGVVLLAITFIVMALSNSTYALFSSDAYGNTNAYTTGMLLIEADSKSENILLDNALPMSDEDGKNITPYIFTIKNIGNLDYEFDVKLLSTGDSSTSFSPQYIKLQIDNGDVITLSGLTNGEIKSDITLAAGDSIDISIRVWLSMDTPNSEIGKSFNSKIVTDGKAVYSSSNNVLTAAQYIRSLYNNADKTEVTNNNIKYHQAQSVSLMNDRLGGKSSSYDSGNVRYYGATPDNYIYFNCSDYNNQNDNTCEKWRIIGVFDDKLKLIRDESIGNYAYDDDSNNWSTSTLNTYLNGDYYNSLSKKTRSFISNSTYYLGGYDGTSLYANQIYNYERTNDVGTTILDGNPFTDDTNIGLMYASDYGYATDFKECSNMHINIYDSPGCYDNDWLFSNSTGISAVSQWTITPSSRFADVQNVVNSLGYVDGDGLYSRIDLENVSVRPVLYLNADVVFGDKGDGTSDNPYQIYVEPPLTLINFIKKQYASGNQELITQETSNDSYYYSYQDDSKTWGLMNDGLKIDTSLDATTTGLATTITNPTVLTNGTEGNIRYFGPSNKVNNYIYFNCSDYSNQTDSTCEKWRIIGIVDGKVKIIRNESIGDLAWDQDKNQVSSLTTYNNNWTTSSLQEFLNGLYYNRGTIESHPYYSGSDGSTTTTLNLKTIGITEATRSMISESTWYLGGYSSASGLYPNDIYNYERKNKVGTTIYSTNDFTIQKDIGLMYPSDYGYATNLKECSKDIYNYETLAACTTNNWLFNSAYQWLITPTSSLSSCAWSVGSPGYVGFYGRVYSAAFGVRPVLYLNSELVMESGHEGTSTNPYRIIVR